MTRMDAKTLTKALVLIALGLGADQITKVWAQGALRSPGGSITVIPNALTIEYAENRAAAFGMFSFIPVEYRYWTLLALTIGLSALLLYFMIFKSPDLASRIGFGVVVAGSIGNIVDRIRLGYVVDFISLHHNSWKWPNFNVADSLICTGVGLLLIFGGRKKPEAQQEQATRPRGS